MQTNIPNKTSTHKYPRLNGKQRFMGKEGCKRSALIQDKGWHPINQETSRGNNIGQKNAWARAFETIELERFQGVYFFIQQLHSKEYQQKMFDKGCHFEAERTKIVLTNILWHYHFSDFEQKHEIECEFKHKRHESEKIT